MNKVILFLAIFAFIAPSVLSADLKENENRELAGVKKTNIKDIIGKVVDAIKNKNNSTKPTTPTNPTTPTTPTEPTTPTTPSEPTTPTTPTTPTEPTTPTTPTQPTTPTEPTTPTTPSEPTTPTTPTQPTTPTTPTTPKDPNVNYAKNDVNMATFQYDCLVIHNNERKAVGVADLTWSDSLAASAQAWAEDMAKNGMRHSGRSGENIASSTYSTKTFLRLIGMWTKEKYHYIPGCTYSKCSTTSDGVGHYTQMVWAKTTQVGCGFAPGYNRGYNYLCCQYSKAGNVVGQTVYPYPIPSTTN